jgi:hypothetical protein
MNIDRVDSGADVPDEGKWVRVEGWGGLEDAR